MRAVWRHVASVRCKPNAHELQTLALRPCSARRKATALAELDPQAPFFDADTETDQLVTRLRIAVYNSALFALRL